LGHDAAGGHCSLISALDGDMRLPERCLVATELSLYRLPKIFQYVEAISDLPRLRCTLACRVGVEAGAIAVDDLQFRMLPEPGRRARRGAIRKQPNHLVLFEIDNDGSIVEAFAPSPLIDTGDADRGMFRLGPGSFLRLQRIVASLTGIPRRDIGRSDGRPPAGWPKSLTIGQASSLASEAGCQVWKPLRKDLTIAYRIAASGCSGSDRHWRSVGREILDCSRI
jgi:hypothetical protein